MAKCDIPINNFNSEEDDFSEWIILFESAVELATDVTDEAQKLKLFEMWLPLKLDNRCRSLLKNCTYGNWKELKIELGKLLVDPQEQYNWQAHRSTITWDGKESFHVLATRVRRLVNLFDAKSNKEREYFFRFRAALPSLYRRAIDLGCDETKQNIEEAKKIAFRVQMAEADSNPTGDTSRLASTQPATFVGASMHDEQSMWERIQALEKEVQGPFT